MPLEQWFFRATRYAAENDDNLDTLSGWDVNALGAQRSLLARVEGVELDATTPAGTREAVFAAEPDALAQAAFVAVSPNHPRLADWVGRAGGERGAARHEIDGLAQRRPRRAPSM